MSVEYARERTTAGPPEEGERDESCLRQDARSEAPSEHSCTLCGARFLEGAPACPGCPLAVGCRLVCCPHCGYQFPESSAIAGRVSRWAGRFRRRRG